MFSTSGEYRDSCGEQVHERFFILIENPNVLNIPDVLMIFPDVLIMVSPQCTEPPPMY